MLNLDQWERKWSEPFCHWAFYCCPPGFPCCPCSCPHLPTSQLPPPPRSPGGPSGGGRAIDGGSVAASKSQTFPVSCPAVVPSLPCVPSDTTPLFSLSSAQSSLEGSSTPSISTFPPMPQHLHIQAFMLHLYMLLGDKAHFTPLGLNLMCNHVIHLPAGSFGSCP